MKTYIIKFGEETISHLFETNSLAAAYAGQLSTAKQIPVEYKRTDEDKFKVINSKWPSSSLPAPLRIGFAML